jgi:hypothetical protein
MLVCVRTTINLPDGLAEAAKRRAASTGQTFTSLVEAGLRHVLSEPDEATTITLPTFGRSGGNVRVDLTDRDAVWATFDAAERG